MGAVVESLLVEIEARGNMVDGTATNRIDQVGNAAIRTEKKTDGLTQSQRGLANAGDTVSSSMKRQIALGASLIASYVGIQAALNGIRASVQVFGEVETGLVAVLKTTDLSSEALAGFSERLSELSVGELPILKTEMLSLAAAAGQLGVRGVENLEAFVDVMARLQVATDVVGEEGARSIARILNVTKEGTETVGTFGAVLTFLGNQAAATESEILAVTTRVAQATAQFGVGSTSALAFATTLKEFGQEAELAGSAMFRTFAAIGKAVAGGGEKLQEFSRIADVSAAEFSAAWEEEPVKAVNLFLEGLGGFKAMTIELEKVGLTGVRLGAVLPVLAENFETLALRQKQAREESERGTALVIESNLAFTTQASDLQRLTNAFLGLGESIGRGMSPALREVTGEMGAFFKEAGGAEEFGRTLGQILTVVADLMLLAAQNADLLAVAFLALIAIQIARWFTATAVSTQILAVANLDLATAVWAVNSGYAKLVVLDIASKMGAWASSSTGLVAALNPVTLILLAIAAAVLAANQAIKTWAAESTAAIQRIAEESRGLLAITERVNAAISSNNLKVMGAEIDKLDLALAGLQKTQASLNQELADLQPIDAMAAAVRNTALGAGDWAEKIADVEERLETNALLIGVNEKLTREITAAYTAWALEAGVLNEEAKKTASEITNLSKATGDLIQELTAQAIAQEQVVRVMNSFGLAAAQAQTVVATLMQAQVDAGATALQAAVNVAELLNRPENQTVLTVVELAQRLDQAEIQANQLTEALARTAARLAELAEINAGLTTGIFVGRFLGTQPDQTDSPGPVAEFADPENDALLDFLTSNREILRIDRERTRELGQQRDVWREMAGIMRDAFGDTEGSFGSMLEGALGIVGAFRGFRGETGGAVGAPSGARAEAALAGAQFGLAVADFGAAVGLFSGPGGTGQFGGARESDRSREGAALGGAVFGVWGSIVGAVIGGFMKEAADHANVIFEQHGTELNVIMGKITNGLSGAILQIARAVREMIENLEDLLNVEINLLNTLGVTDFQIEVGPDLVTVFINGIEQSFDDMGEALGFALKQMLLTATIEGDLGANVSQALTGGGAAGPGGSIDLEKLLGGIEFAQQLDFAAAGTSEFGQNLEGLAIQFRQNSRIVDEFGLSMADNFAMFDRAVQAQGDTIQTAINSLRGVTDLAPGFESITKNATEYNAFIEEQRQSRQAEIDALRALTPEINERIAQGVELEGVYDSLSGELQNASRGAESFEEVLVNTEAAIAALEAGLLTLPNAIDLDQLEEALNTATRNAFVSLGTQLLAFADQWGITLDDQQLVITLRELEFTLAIAQFRLEFEMLEALGRLTAAQISTFENALSTIEGADIDFSRTAGGAGRGQQRRAAIDDLRAQLEDLFLDARGAAAGVLDLRTRLIDFNQTLDEGRRLGFGGEALAQGFRDFVTVAAREAVLGLQDFLDIARGIGSFQRQMIDTRAAFAEAGGQLLLLRNAMEAAGESTVALDQAIAELALAEEFANQAIGINFLRSSLEELGLALPLELVNALAEAEFNRNRQMAITTALLFESETGFSTIGTSLRRVLALIEGAEFVPVTSDGGGAPVAAFDTMRQLFESLFEGNRATLVSLGEEWERLNETAEILNANEAQLVRLRRQEAAAILAVSDAIVARFQADIDAAVGIGAFERRLMDSNAAFRIGRRELEQVARFMERAGFSTAALTRQIADLDRATRSTTQTIGLEWVSSLDQLGVAMPVEITLQLAFAQFQLARAQAISAAAALQAAGFFEAAGLSFAEFVRLIAGAEFSTSKFAAGVQSASSLSATAAHSASALAQSSNALAQAIEAVAAQTDDWLNAGLDPLQAQLKNMTERAIELGQAVLDAGGNMGQLVELEIALNVARQAAFNDLLDTVRARLDVSVRTDPGLKAEDRLAVLQSQFQSVLGEAIANPGQGSFDATSQLFDELSRFGEENFTGSALSNFLSDLRAQFAQLLGLELPEAEIPPLEAILTQVEHLPGIATSTSAAASTLSSALTELQGLMTADDFEALLEAIGPETLADLVATLGAVDFNNLVVDIGSMPLGELINAIQDQSFLPVITALEAGLDFPAVVAAVSQLDPGLASIVQAIGAETFIEIVSALLPISIATAATEEESAATAAAVRTQTDELKAQHKTLRKLDTVNANLDRDGGIQNKLGKIRDSLRTNGELYSVNLRSAVALEALVIHFGASSSSLALQAPQATFRSGVSFAGATQSLQERQLNSLNFVVTGIHSLNLLLTVGNEQRERIDTKIGRVEDKLSDVETAVKSVRKAVDDSAEQQEAAAGRT